VTLTISFVLQCYSWAFVFYVRFILLFWGVFNGVPGSPASPSLSGRGGVQPAGWTFPFRALFLQFYSAAENSLFYSGCPRQSRFRFRYFMLVLRLVLLLILVTPPNCFLGKKPAMRDVS
jgi:hypothetical protein